MFSSNHSQSKGVRGIWQAFCQFWMHDPQYHFTGNPKEGSQYGKFARYYPFYPPAVEQRAWLEKCYQDSCQV
jgi:hypothetical protein